MKKLLWLVLLLTVNLSFGQVPSSTPSNTVVSVAALPTEAESYNQVYFQKDSEGVAVPFPATLSANTTIISHISQNENN